MSAATNDNDNANDNINHKYYYPSNEEAIVAAEEGSALLLSENHDDEENNVRYNNSRQRHRRRGSLIPSAEAFVNIDNTYYNYAGGVLGHHHNRRHSSATTIAATAYNNNGHKIGHHNRRHSAPEIAVVVLSEQQREQLLKLLSPKPQSQEQQAAVVAAAAAAAVSAVIEDEEVGSTTSSSTASDNVDSDRSGSKLLYFLEVIKYTYSTILLLFSIIAIITVSIFSSLSSYPILLAITKFIIFWYLIVWLGQMEGGQGCLVGLQKVDFTEIKDNFHLAYQNMTLVSQNMNSLEHFIVGRQFLVVLVVFVINMLATTTNTTTTNVGGGDGGDGPIIGFDQICGLFLTSGLAAMLVTVIIGQLTAQINAAHCMLDFINNRFMVFTTYVALGVEMSGLLHSVYFVQLVFAKLAVAAGNNNNKPALSADDPSPATSRWGSPIPKFYFWFRVLLSLAVLGASLAVTLTALWHGQTTTWQSFPPYLSIVLLFLLMGLVGIMEGMQIALFAVVHLPPDQLAAHHPVAAKNCDVVFRDQNLQAFLIGRQICVTMCMFVVARFTSVQVMDDPSSDNNNNIFGVNDYWQSFFNTGLLGAILTTILASLVWRVIASSFPIAFLSNPVIIWIIRLCLLLETSGICSASWILARYHKLVMGYQPDQVYLEGAPRHTCKPVTRRDHDIDRMFGIICCHCCCIGGRGILSQPFGNQSKVVVGYYQPDEVCLVDTVDDSREGEC